MGVMRIPDGEYVEIKVPVGGLKYDEPYDVQFTITVRKPEIKMEVDKSNFKVRKHKTAIVS